MTCHRARQLISPYLDQRLTGREMLALQQHFAECASCEAERRSIRQVKMLLRALHEPRPSGDFAEAIAGRLSETDRPRWRVVSLVPPRPQRGRRLVTALALSCLTVLSFAASLAPASRDGVFTSSAFLIPTGLTPGGLNSLHPSLADDVSLASPPTSEAFVLPAASDRHRRERWFVIQYAAPTPSDLRLSPLPEPASPASLGGAASFAAFRTH